MAVRLDKNLRATIDKVVASYNRKITKYKKLGYKVPEKTTYFDVIKLGNRKSINRELKLLSAFNKKSLDPYVYKGVLTNKYEADYFKKRITSTKRILKNRIKKISEIEFKAAGKKAGFTYADRFDLLYSDLASSMNIGRVKNDKLLSTMRKYEIISGTNYSDFLKMSNADKEAFLNLLNRSENPYVNPKLRDNYVDSLLDLGYAYGYDKDKLKIITEKIKSLKAEEFEKVFTEDLAVQRVLSYYNVLKMSLGKNILDNKNDVFDLYDTLFENIDSIIR